MACQVIRRLPLQKGSGDEEMSSVGRACQPSAQTVYKRNGSFATLINLKRAEMTPDLQSSFVVCVVSYDGFLSFVR